MVLLIPTHANHPYLTLAIITAHCPSREHSYLHLHSRNGTSAQGFCQPQFIDPKIGRGAIEFKQFRPLGLGSSMP